MEVKEFGENNKEVLIFLHGGGLSWWNFLDEINLLKEDYHLVLPILDGHSGSDSDFASIEDSAQKIIELIDEKFHGGVKLMAGLSLGAQILLEVLSQRSDACEYAIVESALVYPLPMTLKLIAPSINISYGLINKKWFSKLQFNSLKIKSSLFNYYYEDTCAITKANLTAFMQANSNYQIKESLSKCMAKALILVGSKERPIMKKSAYELHSVIKNSEMEILNGYSHGDISINHADEYVNKLKKLVQ